MRIHRIDIQNFRKLKTCRIDFAEKETIFVGANNSGKTSAMQALMLFLKRPKEISTIDFTLTNWAGINGIAERWVAAYLEGNDIPDLDISSWAPYLPAMDVWLHVEEDEVHYIAHIIPDLDWKGGLLGIRLVFEPGNTESLFKAYIDTHASAQRTTEAHKKRLTEQGVLKEHDLILWPGNMRDFLDKTLNRNFVRRAYILDPSKITEAPQILSSELEPLDHDPFDDLFKIDIIDAQRGFSDSSSSEDDRKLSTNLGRYYRKHLDPTQDPDPTDLDALDAIQNSATVFDEKLEIGFKDAIRELEGLNYPGFDNPRIKLSSKLNHAHSLDHDAAVQFSLIHDPESENPNIWHLPEKYNGLGYRNLIYMVFELIRYRDEWMRVKKAEKALEDKERIIPPIHLVLIEEPEAHLHAQAQQVFIKKAYEVLRNHSNLRENKQFTTQMAISTHSSHVAHEIDFTSLRYFKRISAADRNNIPSTKVINLTDTFGNDTESSRFASRYLRTTHCDLFFADAAILVEGAAEKMLVPYFIRKGYKELNRSYISLLEIGGSHAFRLRPLIETLGLFTLIITDIDSVEINTKSRKKAQRKIQPQLGKNYLTGNYTLRNWIPGKKDLDDLLVATQEEKESSENTVRVAYQIITPVTFNNVQENAIPYSFEDALVLHNLNFFQKRKNTKGMIRKMREATMADSLGEACEKMFHALENDSKAEMALELLYTVEPEILQPPNYIEEGLKWLEDKLKINKTESPLNIGA